MYFWDKHQQMKPILSIITISTLLIAKLGVAQSLTPPDINLETFYTGLASPVGIYHCGDERLFILEKDEGDIEIVDTTGTYIGKFLDVTGLITNGGERGLLGLAFHPNYANNGYFYINYTNTSGHTAIMRYTVSSNPNLADANSAFPIMTINQPFSNHNGGHIAFGPDGYLYIGMGDGGSAGDPGQRAQNPLERLGKMLRIDVEGGSPFAIPPTNPYFGQTDTLPEIWAIGLRNPWKWSFDSETGDMWIGDVGQGSWEEIDLEPSPSEGGYNWGWDCYEGNHDFGTAGCPDASFFDAPVKVYSHGIGFCSITGGMVYRGQRFPALDGIYFFSDYCDGDIMTLAPNGSGGWNEANLYAAGAGIVAFGEDMDGELYVVKNTGTIFRIFDSCPFYPQISGTANGQLQAESGNSYWWYQDGNLISGANEQNYTPTAPGSYSARVSNGTCTRETNSLEWITMSGLGGCTYANAINYDPSAQVDDGSCQFSLNCDCAADLNADGFITVLDLMIFMGLYGSNCFD